MFKHVSTMTSFAVDDVPAAVTLYGETLGLKITEGPGVLFLHHPAGHDTLVPQAGTHSGFAHGLELRGQVHTPLPEPPA